MRKDIDKALDRLKWTIKNATGVDAEIHISAYNPDGKGNRYKIEHHADGGERHLSENMNHKETLKTLDAAQRLIEAITETHYIITRTDAGRRLTRYTTNGGNTKRPEALY